MYIYIYIYISVFQKTSILRKEWVRAMRREDFSPTRFSRLCSKHFKNEDFDRSLNTVRLPDGAVPCIFEAFPAHLNREEKPKRKTPKVRLMDPKELPVQTSVENVEESKTISLTVFSSSQIYGRVE